MAKFLVRVLFCTVPAAWAAFIAVALTLFFSEAPRSIGEAAAIGALFFVCVFGFGWDVTTGPATQPERDGRGND